MNKFEFFSSQQLSRIAYRKLKKTKKYILNHADYGNIN